MHVNYLQGVDGGLRQMDVYSSLSLESRGFEEKHQPMIPEYLKYVYGIKKNV